MRRPEKQYVSISFQFPEEIWVRLRALSFLRGKSPDAIVEELISRIALSSGEERPRD
jgi:hypothetical protein